MSAQPQTQPMPDHLKEYMTEEEWREHRRKVKRRQEARQELLEEVLGVAPRGERGLEVELGEVVTYRRTVDRATWSPGRYSGEKDLDELLERARGSGLGSMRYWRRRPELKEPARGVVVGARTVLSGRYVPGSHTGTMPEDWTQAHLESWRTHRVYLVTGSLWQNPVKVLSDDLILPDEEA